MSTARGVYASTKLLGRGIYDLVEAARMIRRDPYTVARWTQGEHPLHVVPNSPRLGGTMLLFVGQGTAVTATKS